MRLWFVICLTLSLVAIAPLRTQAADVQVIRVGVLKIEREMPLPISRLDLPPADLGFQGGRLATQENLTTGRFTGQDYRLEEMTVPPEEAAAALDAMVETGAHFVVTLANGADLVALSEHAAGRDILLLNAQAEDDALRTTTCLANVLHIAPSRALKADGLSQFLAFKKWRRIFLVAGSHPEDTLWADALRRSARKFGLKIVEERIFEDTGGARRSDTGHVQVQKQMPLFTQRVPDYDILVAADEADVFAGYLPYHTTDPRPVAGSAGLRPLGWHPANEAWGATQYQRRFEKLAKRLVRSLDYQVWLAVRVIGEAATRVKSNEVAPLKDYILGTDFELGVFKGTKVTFRPWNNQLRQPVLLANDRMIVSVSPQNGFLHRVSQLDTLGFDEPESTCAFNE